MEALRNKAEGQSTITQCETYPKWFASLIWSVKSSQKGIPMKSSRSLILGLALVLGLALTACSTPTTRIEANRAAFNTATPAQQEMIKQGVVGLGFTPELVRLAIGDPDVIRTRLDKDGSSEVWLYRTYEYGGRAVYHCYPYRSRYDDAYLLSPAHMGRQVKEYGRIVFVAGKVVSIEREDPVR